MSSTAPADFWDNFHGERPGEANPAPIRPRDERRAPLPPRRRRPMRALFRFLLAVGIGIGGTLAWQAFGDMAREMAAAAYPQQLGWLIPPTASTSSVAAAAPAPAATVGSAVPVATPDQQQLAAVSLSLAGLRRKVEELAAQVASSQQQMAGDIARLQASELDIRAKLSAPPPRSVPAPAHKPTPLVPQTLLPRQQPSTDAERRRRAARRQLAGRICSLSGEPSRCLGERHGKARWQSGRSHLLCLRRCARGRKSAAAETYPSRTITIIVPLLGGRPDRHARAHPGRRHAPFP